MMVRIAALLAFAAAAWAQTVCPPTPRYSVCDLVFDVPSADLYAEFQSPKHVTALVHAFWDGGTRWVIRYTPTEAGVYTFRLSNGTEGQFTATDNNKRGWLEAANVHHFAMAEATVLTPHLWMGGVVADFASMDMARWKALVDVRAQQHFNHLEITLVDESVAANFRSPAFYQAAEEKIRYANDRGIIIDLAFFGPNGLMNRLLPTHDDRQKWFTYVLSRLAAFDVTWQGLEEWETYDNGRALLKEMAEYLSNLDPYKHIKSSRTSVTSAALADDGWMQYRSYQTANDQVSAVEQQVYQFPAVNNFGVGVKDADSFRHRLWNATADGQYPATLIPNEQAANEMKIWYEFMEKTRHWELEPFFDVDNGRAVALGGVEYVIYVEKPGPVAVTPERQSYDIEWLNPITGEHVKAKQKEKEKGENDAVTLTLYPPDTAHDWVLHISREGHKAGMLKSYKFDSRDPPFELQIVEGNPDKVPFDITQPSGDALSQGQPAHFSVKLKRDSKALRSMMYEWTGEVTVSERSYRVIGTGPEGTFDIPTGIAADYPASLHIRVTAMNGLGKVYIVDRNYTLNK
ncbi:MAG: DUF5060 domain-containing protein [Bryobacteraceae bacterium]|jgi:hypothetical protein